MKQQEYFELGEQPQLIKPRIITTSFGKIHSLTAGTAGDPLILVVHGSGPNNSAEQYSYLLHQYLVRISYQAKFYIVAIDCPGYGKSQGKKQVVKIFPLKMFEEILEKLEYTNYYVMLGNSQGAAALFNIVLKSPKITQFLVMDRPICGNVQRFMGFSLPTLLIYDIDDDCRPIWQGNLLYKWLRYAQIYTYRSSVHQFWVQNQIWDKMLRFFNKNFQLQPKYRQEISIQNTHDQQEKKERINNPEQCKRQKSHSVGKFSQKRPKQQKGIQIELIGIPILLQSRVKIQKFRSFTNGKNHPSSRKPSSQHQKSFQGTNEQQRIITKPKQIMKEQLKDEYKCAICYQTLYRPMVTNCKHRFCSKCIMEALLMSQRCPLCRANITKKTQNKQLHQNLIQYISNTDIFRREKQLRKVQTMIKSIVKIEIGNTSELINTKKSMFTRTKNKYNWQLFVKQPKNFQIQQVQLHINLDDQTCKPIKIKNKPFTFESRSTYSFNCQVTIRPKNKEYPDLVEIYLIDAYPGTHSKVYSLRKKCYIK